MSQNPFRTDSSSVYDRPLQLQSDGERTRPIRSAPGGGDHILAFDPITGTGSPSTNAFLAEIRKREDRIIRSVTKVLGQRLAKQQRRIEQLQAALDVEAKRSADALLDAARQFSGQGQTPKPKDDEIVAARRQKQAFVEGADIVFRTRRKD